MKMLLSQKWHPVVIGMYIAITLMFILALSAHGQNVVRKGNTFVEQRDTTHHSGDVETKYVYTDAKGAQYKVYLSKNGNAFIWKTSKNGNKYKRYLPAVTQQLGTKKEK